MTSAIPAHDRAHFAGLSGSLSGTADGRAPLVFLHGLSFDHRIWDPILAGLQRVDANRRVLTLDLPGHGQSPSRLPHSLPHVDRTDPRGDPRSGPGGRPRGTSTRRPLDLRRTGQRLRRALPDERRGEPRRCTGPDGSGHHVAISRRPDSRPPVPAGVADAAGQLPPRPAARARHASGSRPTATLAKTWRPATGSTCSRLRRPNSTPSC